jgi:AraC family transcriptional regulator
MESRIVTSTEKKIIGKRIRMTYSQNMTYELWCSFMPVRKRILNSLSDDLYSIQIYNRDFDFSAFDLNAEFEKWAGMEVNDFDYLPEGMETIVIPGGLYAVFLHKGRASEGERTFKYIFGTWLPQSEFVIDIRPHFEILGPKYKNEDPSSEEEVWIPVCSKNAILY